jgi:glutamate--cysteine ligase
MSDLGYQSNAQAGLTPCYNDLASYTDSLRKRWPRPTAVRRSRHPQGR